MANDKFFYGEIAIVNNLTGKLINSNDLLFTVEGSSITLSFPENYEVLTSDLDDNGNNISYLLYKKFDQDIIWDFGDGTIIKGKTATHWYSRPGQYFITCTCFDADGNPYVNRFLKSNQSVAVVDILDTTIRYTNEYISKLDNGLLNDVYAGEIIEIAELYSILDKNIQSEVPIKCYTALSNSKNIFDMGNDTAYQHLLPYNTFLDKEGNLGLSFLPEYHDVYVSFGYNNSNLTLSIYILDLKYNGEQQYNISLNSDILYDYNIFTVKSLNEISETNYYKIGKIGKISIFYKDDIPSDNIETTFVLDQDYFLDDDIKLSKKNLNLVSIGTSLQIKQNILTGNEIIFYSTNGLTTSDENQIWDLSLKNNVFSFDTAKYVDVRAPFILRIISNKNNPYFIKDIKISNIESNDSSLAFYNYEIEDTPYSNYGAYFCSYTPTEETTDIKKTISFIVNLEDNGGNIIQKSVEINNITVIDLENFNNKNSPNYLNPKQNYIDYSIEDIWETYKTHPTLKDNPNLDTFILAILKNNGLLENIINKGWNFIDDIANISTSEVRNLISLLESLNIKIDLYDNENFSKPNIINNLLKIFSINHSLLVGNNYKGPDEFITYDNQNGKNLGSKIDMIEKIYYPKKGETWPKIVAYDRFAKKYFVINTALIVNAEVDPKQSDDKGSYFTLEQYRNDWAWGLMLPKNYIIDIKIDNNIVKQVANLEPFYFFYKYIETPELTNADAYLKKETISKIDKDTNENVAIDTINDYNTWIKDDGSIDRLLYKTLIENLNLN